ncbi:MAG: hypothetical protein ACRDH1_02195 [Actinomycetota bacterium]
MARMKRPQVSSAGVLATAARRFCPPYEIDEVSSSGMRIGLRDPRGVRPELTLRHRHERRLFLKANYLVVESAVPGAGPSEDGELSFRFRGPFARQKASLRWRRPVQDGPAWSDRLEEPLLRGIRDVQAVESFRIRWDVAERTWHLYLETLSGSMLGGFMSPLPIPVPIDAEEVEGIIALIDALASTGE